MCKPVGSLELNLYSTQCGDEDFKESNLGINKSIVDLLIKVVE